MLAEEVESRILPELAALLNAAGLITIFSVSRPDLAECERARKQVGPNRFFDFDPQSLAASDEEAAEQIRAVLEKNGILPGRGGFPVAEGI